MGPHLWNIRAVRDVALIGAVVLFFVLLVRMQAATLPILIAFVLAYVLEPIIALLERRLGWPRAVIVAGMIVLLFASMAVFFVALVPRLVQQVLRLAERIPSYLEVLQKRFGLDELSPANLEKWFERWAGGNPAHLADAFGGAGQVIGTLSAVLGTTLSLITASVLTLIVFAFFALRFPQLPSVRQFLPKSQRDELWNRLEQIEHVFAGFIRGQLLVAVFTTTIFSIGFALSGVPYWFVASLFGGTFSIVPYGQAAGWMLAVVFSLFEGMAGEGPPFDWAALIGPTVTYAVMQGLETFIVTPLVQGSSTKLHPVAVLVAVIAGGGLGGLVGVFLAIPLTAIARIFTVEILIPQFRAWADRH